MRERSELGVPVGMDLVRSQRGLPLFLARSLGLAASTVSGWERVPAERVHEVERLSGVPRYWLRPDLWAPPWVREAAWFREHGVREED